jgi:hypothetical protein
VVIASSCSTKRLSSADSESPRWRAVAEKRCLDSVVIQVERWAEVPISQDLNTPNEPRKAGIRAKFRESPPPTQQRCVVAGEGLDQTAADRLVILQSAQNQRNRMRDVCPLRSVRIFGYILNRRESSGGSRPEPGIPWVQLTGTKLPFRLCKFTSVSQSNFCASVDTTDAPSFIGVSR